MPFSSCALPYHCCLISMGNKLVTGTVPQYFPCWRRHEHFCVCTEIHTHTGNPGITAVVWPCPLPLCWGKEFLLCTLKHQSMQILLEIHYISLNRLAESHTNRPDDRRSQEYCGRHPHLLIIQVTVCEKLTTTPFPTQPRHLYIIL